MARTLTQAQATILGAVLGAIITGAVTLLVATLNKRDEREKIQSLNTDLKTNEQKRQKSDQQLQAALTALDKSNRSNNKVPAKLLPKGTYEWQWAGEGWKGYIEVNDRGAARVEMNRYLTCANGQIKSVRLLEQQGNAEVNAVGPRTLHVNIPVKFLTYDRDCNPTGPEPVVKTLIGDIYERTAFTGKIKYTTPEAAPPGDMVLVKDYLSGP